MSSRPHGTQKQIQIQNLLRFITVAEDLRNDINCVHVVPMK